MKLRYFTLISIVCWFWALQSCKPTRHIQPGQHLVMKNVIHLNENNEHKSEVGEEALASVIKQKPNRRILGFIPFHLSVWNYANSRDQGKKRNEYLKNTIGEAPVLFEPVLLEKSRDQLLRYLQNHGYFEADVSAYAFLDEKETELHYYIYTGPAYTLRKLSYAFEDTSLIREFSGGVKTSLTSGDRFDADQFDLERERLTNTMKDLGYYTFEKIHVVFNVDTALPGTRFDVSVRLRNQRKSTEIMGRDTIVEEPHRKHHINKVTINQHFEASQAGRQFWDSLYYRELLFLYIGKPVVRPPRLARTVFVRPGDIYSASKTQYTYERINALGNFRFIDLKYEVVPTSPPTSPQLDLTVNLTEAPKQSMTLETIGTNRSGNLGVSAGLNYRNKNLFRGAEQFDWKVYGGLEAQRTNSTIDGNDAEVIRLTPFNTYEFGSRIGLTIPDFLIRFNRKELPWFKEPRTTLSVSADRQVRPQYDRNLINTSYQIAMRLRTQDQLTIAPADLSVIRLHKEPEFEELLLRTNNSLLINSYNNHIIAAGKVSYSNTTQQINKLVNFHYYRLNFESAGNLLRLASRPLNLPYSSERNSYMIDSIAFAQYVKFDLSFTRHLLLTPKSRYVYRFFGGIGQPLANLNTLPFERSFFAGGSNDIRAWQARGLGPGSLADTATYGIDQVGEFQLELNLEYRFPIFNQIEGAVFTDFGNIWLLRYDPLRPGAEFRMQSFYREIAIAPGAGIRFNFNFFVFRLDMGVQLKDPALPQGERWAFQPKDLTNQYRETANVGRIMSGLQPIETWTKPQTTVNFAIDYPF